MACRTEPVGSVFFLRGICGNVFFFAVWRRQATDTTRKNFRKKVVMSNNNRFLSDCHAGNMNGAEAFETAWDSVQKEYTLDWRDRAKNLRPITHEAQLGKPIGSGADSKVFMHPFGYGDFVVKLPRSEPSGWEWNGADTTEERNRLFHRRFRNDRRGGWEEYQGGKGLPQIMEELGFPVVSEMLLDPLDSLHTFVQPVLKPEDALEDLLDINAPPQDIDWREFRKKQHRENMQFDNALAYALGDLMGGHNRMRDGQGRLRAMDMGMDFPDLYDGHPIDYDVDYLNDYGIDFPATKLLNEMDVHDIDRPHYKEYLEALEPHVTNSRTLRIDGRPLYLTGY